MSETIIAALLGVAGTLIAGFGGAWLGARIARDAGRNLLGQQAKSEFVSVFIETLTELHEGPSDIGVGKAWEILKTNYPRHFAAYLKLRNTVPLRDRQAIDRAWSEYTKDDDGEEPAERVFNRFSHVLGPRLDGDQFKLAIEHVNRLRFLRPNVRVEAETTE